VKEFVVVDGSDPRKASVFGIVRSNIATLLSDSEQATAMKSGGKAAVEMAALTNFYQLNEWFRRELQDGKMSGKKGDPDMLLNGLRIRVKA